MPDSSAPLFHSARYTDPQQVLEAIFGFREFRPGQRRIIDAVLAGRDCIGVMPTGAGKSLTFQVPARMLPGTVLVISPLISLMKDQVDALVRLGFRATTVNSTLEPDERRARLAAFRRGEIELLYLAPEALEGSLRGMIAGCNVSLVVVDEAHCISHWGHDFRPAYRRLAGLKQELGEIPVLALTATATRRVVGDILRQLGMRKPDGFKGSFFRPNLRITAVRKGPGRDAGGEAGRPSAARNVRRDLLGLLRARRGESAIIYCMSRKSVESTAAFLSEHGIRAAAYHAGLPDDTRHRNQDAFARDDIDVIVATVAFGMGIDKSNVRLVVHRDMPKSIEAWVQEIGRAGRDGLPSECIVYYSWADVIGYDTFLDGIEDAELREETRRKTVELFRLLDRGGCRHRAACAYFDEVLEPCGNACDVCTGEGIEALVGTAVGPALRAGTPPGRSRSAAPSGTELSDEARERFERLRAVRKRLADAEGVPAYIVFSDAALRGMAERLPKSPSELLEVPGVGPVKLERYGEAFLDALRSSG